MLTILKAWRRRGIVRAATLDAETNTTTTDPAINALQRQISRQLGRALAIRQVDAGSCNGCELELHALANPYYNLEGHGIVFVASPRHADMLLVTGPITVNMHEALLRTYAATPKPKWLVAVGDCADHGGVFASERDRNYACIGSLARLLPVDAVIRGCPPTPLQLVNGIVAAIARPPKSQLG